MALGSDSDVPLATAGVADLGPCVVDALGGELAVTAAALAPALANALADAFADALGGGLALTAGALASALAHALADAFADALADALAFAAKCSVIGTTVLDEDDAPGVSTCT